MRYENTTEGIFLERPNRFVAYVLIDSKKEKVHVKNTGRCRELLVPGAKVILEEGNNPNRKTKYSIIAVYKGNILINMDSQAPNAAAAEALKSGKITEIDTPDLIKREVTYSKSRFDIYYEKNGTKGFIEVKGVTLEKNGMMYFPDAPTERGARHIEELIKAKNEGYEANVLFVIQLKGVTGFSPNIETDPKFAETLKKAAESGVNILAYDCIVDKNSIKIDKQVPVIL